MPVAALLALAIMTGDAAGPSPETQNPSPQTQGPVAPSSAGAPTKGPGDTADADEGDDLPSNAPKDPYRLVAWCYGALDEYVGLYDSVKPDLKEIDKLFGSPVHESEPYAEDVAGERQALKRFAAAMEAAERASPQPISGQGVAAMNQGRAIWSSAKQLPHRKLADAWLFWGVPKRCETTAKSLRTNATLLGQALAVQAPSVEGAPPPAPTPPAAP